MRTITTIFLFIVLFSGVSGQTPTDTVLFNNFSCVYNKKDGKLDGTYSSYYKDGQIRATGLFKDNFRTGTWSVYDSIGKLVIKREYSAPYTFKQIFPILPENELTRLLNVQWSPQKNEKGYIEYFNIQERMVVFSRVYKSYISSRNNPLLFNNDILFRLISSGIKTKKLTAYDVKTDEFEDTLSNEVDPNLYRHIAFKTKEVCFFDSERMLMDSRIIGICPVAINKISGDTTDLYWIYYPYLRPFLAEEKVKSNGMPAYISNLDDLLFYRQYSGIIFYVRNWQNPTPELKIENATEDFSKQAIIELIETEHDIWRDYSK